VSARADDDHAVPTADRSTEESVDQRLTAGLAASRTGDEAAFTTVYSLVQPMLLRYLRVLVGKDAEDVAAETWARAVRDWDRFDGTAAGFRAWIATIGRHRAIDHLRSKDRRPVVPVAPEMFLDERDPHDTETDALDHLATERAVRLVASLPSDQAEAVMLRTVLGLDAISAGRLLGKRPGAVRTATHRGLKTLAARLGGEER
jgi:RNA polymerase sigma-70 factor (ECF subfamily)